MDSVDCKDLFGEDATCDPATVECKTAAKPIECNEACQEKMRRASEYGRLFNPY